MPAGIPRPSSVENVSTTLSSGITDVATSMDVADATNIASPCYLVIDRVDSAGTIKATSLWEYVKVTNVAGNTLTISRGQNGSTGQAHGSGAVVEAVVTSAMFEDWRAVLDPEHDSAGGHVIVGTMTIAGMNLASVATIAVGTFNHLRANVSTSGIGLSLNPIWFTSGTVSGPTTNVSRLVMPRPGTFQFFNLYTRTPVSTASLNVTLFSPNLGNPSVFDKICVPGILGGGTFASTASIKTPNFRAGDVLQMDIVTGGNVSDITLQGCAY